MSLKKKFLQQIFPPLLLSVIFTAVISTLFIVFYHFRTINATKQAILETEKNDMEFFASIISSHFELNLQNLMSDLKNLLTDAENIMKTDTWRNENKYFISSYDIATHKMDLTNISGYDNETQRNLDYSMWYIPGKENITTQMEKDHYIFFSKMDSLLRVIFSSEPKYKLIYAYFEDNGFQYKYPSYESSGFISFKSNESCEYTLSGLTEFFDKRCRPYGKDIKEFIHIPNLTNTIMFSEPFQYLENGILGITSCGYNIKNSTNYNFSLIPPENRILNYAFCINFDLQDLVAPQNLFDYKQLYFYILNGEDVFFHPSFLKHQNFSKCSSITECEFEDLQRTSLFEIMDFNETITKIIESYYKFDMHDSTIFEFRKNGKFYLATAMPIFISRTGDNSNFFLCIIVEPENLIFENFDKISEKNEEFIILQTVVFVVIVIIVVIVGLVLINETVKSIINPISDLCNIVKSLSNDDLDADVTKNYTPNSKEIDQLYQSFSKLKFIMKYANQEFLSGNDAQALINYANALNLYLELNQKEGVGITYNNMGNIHLKNERYEEAIACYKMAVQTIEEELNEIYKGNQNQQSFTIKRLSEKNNTESQVSNESFRIFLGISKRRKGKTSLKSYSSEKINQKNNMYSNRLYQLAKTLYMNYAKNKVKNPEEWQEVINYLEKVIEVDAHLQSNNSRAIECLILIANSYLEFGNDLGCLKYLKEAENSLCLYEKVESLMKLSSELKAENNEDSLKSTIQRYQNIKEKFQGSADILKQKLMYHYGVFYKKIGKYKQACIMFTQSIELGKIYDPFIRKKSLEVLSNLLASQNLLHKAPNITNILARMEDINHKDIVFLLDYSESMGKGARIQYAIRNFVKIFDKYIKDSDRIGFIRFNLNCEAVFDLTFKKLNTLQLRKHIENSLNPFGKTAFFDALKGALHQFNYDNFMFSHHENNKRSKWIVSLTDGEDNASQITSKNIKEQLKQSDVNLIIVGMGLSKNLIQELKELCQATKDGVFIESPNNDDLDVAFQALCRIIYGENVIIESV